MRSLLAAKKGTVFGWRVQAGHGSGPCSLPRPPRLPRQHLAPCLHLWHHRSPVLAKRRLRLP